MFVILSPGAFRDSIGVHYAGDGHICWQVVCFGIKISGQDYGREFTSLDLLPNFNISKEK